MTILTRRTALLGAAALPLLTRPAAAQAAGRVVVGTWGGDYARLLRKNVEEPFLVSKGWDVVQDQAGDAPRRAKMVAERRLPRGTVDIQGLSAANMYEMGEAGVAEPIDYARLKNAANLLPAMRYQHGVGHIYSGKVVLFNPKLVEKPAGFRDCMDPRHGGKLGFIDIQYQFVMVAAALAAGGSVSNLEPGKAVLLEAKKAGARLYPTNEAFAQAMKTEEIALGVMWKARGVQWQNADIPLQMVAPVEGIPMYVSGFSIQKNAPNKAGAYAYMDAMLEKAAQEAFAIDMGFNPTVGNAVVAPDLHARIGFTEAEERRLVDLDYAYLARENAAMKEWWDKVFKGVSAPAPRRFGAAALVAPATLCVVLGLLLPLGLLFRYSLNAFVPGQFMVEALTLANYVKFFTDPFYLAVLWRTLRIAALVTAICLVLGFPLAYVLARTRSRFKNLLIIAVVLPLFVGNAVRAAGWMVAFGSKGAVNATLLGLGLVARPLDIMFTETAVVIGITAVNLPFMVLSLQSVLEGIDQSVEEAAFNLGAPPGMMLRRVLLPLAMPGVLAGCILTFILGMNAYATPVLLGGPRFQTMGPLVYGQFIEQNNWPFGGAIAFILMTVTLLLTTLSHLLVQRRMARG